MPNRDSHRLLMRLAAVTACVALACGCTDAVEPSPQSAHSPVSSERDGLAEPEELEDMCPEVLPQQPGPDGWVGTDESAEASPRLLEPDRAWLCTYGMKGPDRRWVLRADDGLDASQLAAVSEAFAGLSPPHSKGETCTEELGPRWMVVGATATARVGVVVDGFGCNKVRLTDDPHVAPPGEGRTHGTVPGVLNLGEDGKALLALLNATR